MLKVDLKKAFVSVQWNFLEDLLRAMHFANAYTKWMMACVPNVKFFLHLNGRIHGSFLGWRGLR